MHESVAVQRCRRSATSHNSWGVRLTEGSGSAEQFPDAQATCASALTDREDARGGDCVEVVQAARSRAGRKSTACSRIGVSREAVSEDTRRGRAA